MKNLRYFALFFLAFAAVAAAPGRKRSVEEEEDDGAGGPLVGAPAKLNLNDPMLRKAAAASVRKINAASKDKIYRSMVSIVKATQQIVAGTLYQLELKVAETRCSKAQAAQHKYSRSKCPFKTNGRSNTCKTEVWSQPWLNKMEVTVKRCSPAL